MPSGEHDHPLRADPLQSLPDAISVPRRRRRRTQSLSSSSLPLSPKPPSPIINANFQHHTASSSDRQALQLDTFKNHTLPSDPLRLALIETAAPPLPLPPAGEAFATDVDSLLRDADEDNDHVERRNAKVEGLELTNDAFVADVTLIPVAAEQGSAAGVYVIQSCQVRRLHNPQPQVQSNQQRAHSPLPSPPPPPPSSLKTSALIATAATSTIIRSYSQQQQILPALSLPPDTKRVRRSIADFNWFRNLLTLTYDGIIVPSLPSMSLSGRLTHGPLYDHARLNGLSRFLHRVSTHPILSHGTELPIFTGHSGEPAFQKLRQLPLPSPSIISPLLDDGGAWRQLGRRVNDGLAWLLDRKEEEREVDEDSGKARLGRLTTYVSELGGGLGSVRECVGRVGKGREGGARATDRFQNAIGEVARREGGRLATYFGDLGIENGVAVGLNGGTVKLQREKEKGKETGKVGGIRGERGNAAQEVNVKAVHCAEGERNGIDGERVGKRERNIRGNSGEAAVVGMTESDEDGDRENGRKLHGMNGVSTRNGATHTHTDRNIANWETLSRSPIISPLSSSPSSKQTSRKRVGSATAIRLLEAAITDYEERARGAKRIMSLRQEEQETYERALQTYKKLRDKLEAFTDYHTSGDEPVSTEEVEIGRQVNEAARKLGTVRKQYQAVAVRTTDELRRLRRDLHDDLSEGLLLVALEIGAECRDEAERWDGLAERLAAYRKEVMTTTMAASTSSAGVS